MFGRGAIPTAGFDNHSVNFGSSPNYREAILRLQFYPSATISGNFGAAVAGSLNLGESYHLGLLLVP
jgi:hypothetical protein